MAPLVLISLLVLLLAGAAQAQSPVLKLIDPELEKQVIAMLSGIETTPKADTWRKLGTDAPYALMKVVLDTKEWPARRARAVTALKYFPTPETKQFLTELLDRKERVAPLLTRKALYALAEAWGAEAAPLIAQKLDNDDLFVREAAVRALAKAGGPDVLRLLKQREVKEPEAVVRRVIQEEVRKIE